MRIGDHYRTPGFCKEIGCTQQEHSAELLKNEQTKAAQQAESMRQNIQKLQDKLDENARLLNEAYTVSASLKTENRNMAEKLENQKEEIAAMHKQFNLEFEFPAEDRDFQQTEYRKPQQSAKTFR